MLQELNPDCGRATGVDSLTSLIWLTLGAFAIGTEGFMIAGLLPALARDLNVGLPAAGHLVTAFSLAYAIGAPVMAVLTAGLERRRLLAVAMGGFALANLLAALAPGYAGLLAARLLLALSAASFMPAASGYAAALGGPERRGRALSTVTTGLTLAIIAGVPLGVLVGQGFGWRATFFGVAGLAAFSLLGILARLPRQPPAASAAPAPVTPAPAPTRRPCRTQATSWIAALVVPIAPSTRARAWPHRPTRAPPWTPHSAPSRTPPTPNAKPRTPMRGATPPLQPRTNAATTSTASPATLDHRTMSLDQLKAQARAIKDAAYAEKEAADCEAWRHAK